MELLLSNPVFLLLLELSTRLFFLIDDVVVLHMEEILILFLEEVDVDFLTLLFYWDVEIVLRVVLF